MYKKLIPTYIKVILTISLLLFGIKTWAAPNLLDQMRSIRFDFISANMYLALTPDLDKCKCYDNIMLFERKNTFILDKIDAIIVALGGSKNLTQEEAKKLDEINSITVWKK